MKVGRFAALHTRPVRPDRKSPPYPGGHQPHTAAGNVVKQLPARRTAGDGRPARKVRAACRPAWLVLVAAGLTAGAAGAHAHPAADPHQFSDRTAEFIPLGAPNALAARDTGKQLVLSPHGTRRSIVCRGNGTTVPLYDCSQEDGLGWAPLHRNDTPVGEVWIYFP